MTSENFIQYARKIFLTVLGSCFIVYVAMILLSYSPMDSSWSHIGSNTVIANMGGKTGAWIADLLFTFLGHSIWLLLLVVLYEVSLLWWQRKVTLLPLRILGYMFLLLALSASLTIHSTIGQTLIDPDTGNLYLPLSIAEDMLASGGVVGYELAIRLHLMLTQLWTVLFLFVFVFLTATFAFDIHWVAFAKRLIYRDRHEEAEHGADETDLLEGSDDSSQAETEKPLDTIEKQPQDNKAAEEEFIIDLSTGERLSKHQQLRLNFNKKLPEASESNNQEGKNTRVSNHTDAGNHLSDDLGHDSNLNLSDEQDQSKQSTQRIQARQQAGTDTPELDEFLYQSDFTELSAAQFAPTATSQSTDGFEATTSLKSTNSSKSTNHFKQSEHKQPNNKQLNNKQSSSQSTTSNRSIHSSVHGATHSQSMNASSATARTAMMDTQVNKSQLNKAQATAIKVEPTFDWNNPDTVEHLLSEAEQVEQQRRLEIMQANHHANSHTDYHEDKLADSQSTNVNNQPTAKQSKIAQHAEDKVTPTNGQGLHFDYFQEVDAYPNSNHDTQATTDKLNLTGTQSNRTQGAEEITSAWLALTDLPDIQDVQTEMSSVKQESELATTSTIATASTIDTGNAGQESQDNPDDDNYLECDYGYDNDYLNGEELTHYFETEHDIAEDITNSLLVDYSESTVSQFEQGTNSAQVIESSQTERLPVKKTSQTTSGMMLNEKEDKQTPVVEMSTKPAVATKLANKFAKKDEGNKVVEQTQQQKIDDTKSEIVSNSAKANSPQLPKKTGNNKEDSSKKNNNDTYNDIKVANSAKLKNQSKPINKAQTADKATESSNSMLDKIRANKPSSNKNGMTKLTASIKTMLQNTHKVAEKQTQADNKSQPLNGQATEDLNHRSSVNEVSGDKIKKGEIAEAEHHEFEYREIDVQEVDVKETEFRESDFKEVAIQEVEFKEHDIQTPTEAIIEPVEAMEQVGTQQQQPAFNEQAPVHLPDIADDHAFVGKSRAFQTAKYRQSLSDIPSLDILDRPDPDRQPSYTADELQQLSDLLEIKLQDFNIKAEVVHAIPGPVVTRFEVELAPGVKVAKVVNISRDLARSLSMASLRVVEIIPGKPYIGIEVPNKKREMVRLIELLDTEKYRDPNGQISMAMGKDIGGKPIITDLAKAPHMLVAGTTGSGKSVLVNSMLLSMLLKYKPEELRLILVDPKQLELANYNDIPHLLTPVVTDMTEAAGALSWCVSEMERRYQLMSLLRVRKLKEFNKKVIEAEKAGQPIIDPLWRPNDSVSIDKAPKLKPLPMIVIVADEFADMIMQVGKQAEELITRLAQKSRASGIHLMLATQRPSVDVITGLIKANVPVRAALRVNSKVDSRTILDTGGAEDMLGNGDMLFLGPGQIEAERVHGAFVSDEEVNRVCEAWRERGAPDYIDNFGDNFQLASSDSSGSSSGGTSGEDDSFYNEAVAFVLETRKVSASSIQRKFSIGYNRAARIVDSMEEAGIVGPMIKGKREILV